MFDILADLLDVFVDLGTDPSPALPEVPDVPVEGVDTFAAGDNWSDVSFTGKHCAIEVGMDTPERLAGYQAETSQCAVHAMGNMVQAQNPVMGEEINRNIMDIARDHGGLIQGQTSATVHPNYYEPILEKYFNTPCTWGNSDPTELVGAVGKGHMALAIGDAHYLDPSTYAPNSAHAFNITGFGWEDGKMFVKGLDSNFPGEEKVWPLENVQKAMRAASEEFNYSNNVLLTDKPVMRTAWT